MSLSVPDITCGFVHAILFAGLLDFMGTSPQLWFLHAKTSTFGPELQVSKGTRPHLSFCA